VLLYSELDRERREEAIHMIAVDRGDPVEFTERDGEEAGSCAAGDGSSTG
jgi:hypothetical protein